MHVARRTLWPLEPGEWLILTAINVVTVLGGGALAGFWEAGEWLFWGAPAELATVFIVAAVMLRDLRIWSALFWTLAVASLSFYLMVLLDTGPRSIRRLEIFLLVGYSLIAGFSILSLTLLTAGVVSDRRSRQARHWLHWSAVVLAGLALIGVAGTAIFVLFMLLL